MCLALRLEATDRRARNVLLMTEYQWISRDLVGYTNATASGAFSLSKNANAELSSGYGVTTASLTFSARSSSSAYGGSSGVQPPSISLLPCIKT